MLYLPLSACSFVSPPPPKESNSAAVIRSAEIWVSVTTVALGSLKLVRIHFGTSDPLSTSSLIVAFTKGRDFCIDLKRGSLRANNLL